MRIIYPLVVLSLSFSVMSCSRSKDSSTEEVEISSTFDKDEVQKQLTKLFMAVNSADIETTLKFTHPYTIKLMGGEDQARTILKSTFESVDMEVESVNFPELPTYEEGEEHDFVVVPVKWIFSVEGSRVESSTFQLGVREKGEEWKYFEGSSIEGTKVIGKELKTIFPDFPSSLKFPKTSKKLL